MNNGEVLSKKIIGVGVLVLCIGLAYAAIGYGYKEIKDSRFLNIDPARVISVKGVSIMEVVSDKTVVTFSLSGQGSSSKIASTNFNIAEKKLYANLDPKVASRIEKVNIVSYHDDSPVYVFYTMRTYQITLNTSSQEEVESVRSALIDAGIDDVYLRYTLKNPEEKYKALTEAALKNARDQAFLVAKQSDSRLGDLTYAGVGTYNTTSQAYDYDNAYDFFYSMTFPHLDMTQTAYLTYRIK